MNWFDIILIILLLVGGLEGFRRGFFREILKVGGFIIVLYLSFIFMNPLGNLLFKYLPLFSLHIIGIEIAALNILLYEIISFLLISTILYVILNFILTITGLISKVISISKVINLPFKILGAIVGILSNYILIIFLLLILAIPLGKVDAYRNSTLKNYFLNSPILITSQIKNLNSSINEVYDLTEEIKNDKSRIKHSDEYNAKSFDIMLKNKIVSIDTVDELIDNGKIRNYKELDQVLNIYRKEN